VKVGVPKEIKADELRVGLTPAGTRELVRAGHDVLLERGAGTGSGFADEAYTLEGARILDDAPELFEEAELIVKVKEPLRREVELLREDQMLFTYLHLAADPTLATLLCDRGTTCIAYETVADASGRLPLLTPMSEVAGRVAAMAGTFMLNAALGGRGLLAGGVPGVEPAVVSILGGGVVGTNAAVVARGMGADVRIYDRSLQRLRELDDLLGSTVQTRFASSLAVERALEESDVVIGAVLIQGARAPRLATRADLAPMRQGAVLVDVSIDQGGCFETSRPTTHSEPTFEVDGVVHYCVANMPGAMPRTSTPALTNATLPFVIALADDAEHALGAELASGLNIRHGEIVHPAVQAAVA
jgi:alanine dehydrogenase